MRQRDYICVEDEDGSAYSFIYTFNKHARQNKASIHGGRIDSLSLLTLDDKIVAQYDKGWIILPGSYTPEGKALETIIERWN